jgi:hypothetical protein
MSEVVRLCRYKSLLCSRTAVSADDRMATQEVSRATLKSDIAMLRDQLHVPIRFDRDLGVCILEADAVEVSAKKIDKALGTGTGIFNGAALSWAKLRCAARYRTGFGRWRRGMFSRFCRNESRKKEPRV